MKNYQNLHYKKFYLMLPDGSTIETTRRKCFAYPEPVTEENPYPQRWYYSPDGEMAIRLCRNAESETISRHNRAALKAEERAADSKYLCVGQTALAACCITCENCPLKDCCKSKSREDNGATCTRKCDCCSSYKRAIADIDSPIGEDEDDETTYEVPDESVNIEEEYCADEHQRAIADVIATLDPTDRELWLCMVQQKKQTEIADRLHMTVDGVYYRRKRLEKLLRENEVLKKIFENL